jgi:tRNA A-37 threonylcarbamoyl transferase component Bud32
VKKPVRGGGGDITAIHTLRRHGSYQTRYQNPALHRFIANPDRYLEQECGRILKQDDSSTVGVCALAEWRVVVKRYSIRSIAHGCKQALRRSRAEISWHNAMLLRQYNIATPEPIIALEVRRGILRRQAFFVSEYVEGALGTEFFAVADNATETQIDRIVGVFKDLYRHQISHGDMKATNFIMASGGPVLIDLDAMRQHRSIHVHRHRFHRDKRRFLRNWSDNVVLQQQFAQRLERIDR